MPKMSGRGVRADLLIWEMHGEAHNIGPLFVHAKSEDAQAGLYGSHIPRVNELLNLNLKDFALRSSLHQ